MLLGLDRLTEELKDWKWDGDGSLGQQMDVSRQCSYTF